MLTAAPLRSGGTSAKKKADKPLAQKQTIFQKKRPQRFDSKRPFIQKLPVLDEFRNWLYTEEVGKLSKELLLIGQTGLLNFNSEDT